MDKEYPSSFDEGEIAERERILKLINPVLKNNIGCYFSDGSHNYEKEGRVIDRIKIELKQKIEEINVNSHKN